jgi:hypothetical protein
MNGSKKSVMNELNNEGMRNFIEYKIVDGIRRVNWRFHAEARLVTRIMQILISYIYIVSLTSYIQL